MGLWDKVKGAFSGGGSSSDKDDDKKSSYSSSSSYDKKTELGVTRPKARGQSDEDYSASMKRHLERRESRDDKDNDPKSGNRYATTSQQGVTTNKLGVPQYDYSERSATSKKDDKDGDGYSDFYTANPSSTISPEGYKAAQIGSKLAILANPAIGLTGATLAKLMRKGIIPNLGNAASGAGAKTAGPVDKEVNRIMNDPKMSDADKAQAVKDTITNAVTSEEAAKRAQTGIAMVDKLTTNAYNPAGNDDPADMVNNPQGFLTRTGADLSSNTPQINGNAPGTVMGDPDELNAGGLNYDPATAEAQAAGGVEAQQAQGYDAVTAADDVAMYGQADAAQGQVSPDALVDAEQVDVEGAANGSTALGKALNDYASQGMSTIIDTSTAAGKMLAQQLGEGNYVDSKATMAGQLEILSKQFVGPNGEPTIPSWAAATARNVSRIAAFKGMTGTAATAAMSQALMEASLPMAQQDAQFFQTLTAKNLDNRQQMTINKASVLANMELANLDARMQAAVTNSQAFLQMDLANLTNEQQAEIVNTQARVQAILEDAKSQNAARAFTADAENSFTQFYDQLNSQISMFNSEQANAMRKFNAGEINDASEFNAQMENQRELFYREMQYNVDLANARWRQTVETENTAMKFEAAKTDAMSILKISSEALNRMWDREDAILDYTWRSSESELERAIDMYKADRIYALDKRRIDNEESAAKGAAFYEGLKFLASDGDDLLDFVFG